jgi:hypothetical protein
MLHHWLVYVGVACAGAFALVALHSVRSRVKRWWARVRRRQRQRRLTGTVRSASPSTGDAGGTPGYVYMLIEREFISRRPAVVKVGRTRQFDPRKRLQCYPKGSRVLQVCCVRDCRAAELAVLRHFRQRHEARRDIGAEYFAGDLEDMQRDFLQHVCLNNNAAL